MALTFPREMPCGVETVEFDLGRFMAANKLYGGVTQVREMAEPRWRATFTYAPLAPLEFQALQAWLDSLRGGMRTFLGHDPLKPYPVAFQAAVPALTRAAGGAFDWRADVQVLTADTIVMNGLPPNFTLRAGDMVGLEEGSKRGLYRIVEDAVATLGGDASMVVEPRVLTSWFTTGAAAVFRRPSCLMTLDPASISASRTARMRSPITFSGIQAVF